MLICLQLLTVHAVAAHQELTDPALGVELRLQLQIATDAYGINGIPEIILFAPDGTILARGLRGNEIEKKMAEFFVE